MKNITIFIGLVFSFFLFSQCKNTEPVESQILNIEKWIMTGIACFCQSLPTFELGEIIWTFDHNINLLTIENNTNSNYSYSEYPFEFKTDNLIVDFIPDRVDFQMWVDEEKLLLYNDSSPTIADEETSYGFVPIK